MTNRHSGPLVGVFLAGVQKAGTTSLFAHCVEHTELISPLQKEPHYFDDEGVDWLRPDYTEFHAHYPALASEGKRFDSTPIYSYWPPAAARIAEYNPMAKIIVVFRDPIERAWSHWCMEFARGTETLLFADAIRSGRDRVASASSTSIESRLYSYVERGFYTSQVRRLLAYFQRDQLLFLRSEDLSARHVDALARIATFLEIGPFPVGGPKREHTMPSGLPSVLSEEDVGYLRGLFRGEMVAFSRMTALDVSDWLTMRDGAQS